MKNLNIALTGLDAHYEQTSARHIAQSIKASSRYGKSKIIALNYALNTIHRIDGIPDKSVLITSPDIDENIFQEEMSRIIVNEGIDLILPTSCFEIPYFENLRKYCEDKKISVHIPCIYENYLSDPLKLYRLCYKHKIPCPQTFQIHNEWELRNLSFYFSYPMLLTDSRGYRKICYSFDEIAVNLRHLKQYKNNSVFLQYHIAGETYQAAVLLDQSSLMIGNVVAKDIIMAEDDHPWAAMTVTFPYLKKLIEDILFRMALHYTGPLEMTFKKNLTSQQIYLMEAKCRFPCWIHLATRAECNLAERYLDILFQEKFDPEMYYRPGVIMVRNMQDNVYSNKLLAQLLTKGEIYYEAL
ncbi:MAG: hypothetical protein HYS98_04870 [Deltaproteobacteria bacterium]|nr:hypothetical protein [Deltaproteobacteria bacterium]